MAAFYELITEKEYPALMNTCMCGNPIDTIGSTCSRCGALQTLGLEMNASAAEIESTYLTLVKVWHPDRFQTDLKLRRVAEEKLKEINAAHDLLISEPPVEEPRRPARKPEPEPIMEPDETLTPGFVSSESPKEEHEEVRRILRRYKKRSVSTILLKVIVAAAGIAVILLLWFSLDSLLLANSRTAGPWAEFKTEVSRDIHANGMRIWGDATGNLRGSKNENALPPIHLAAQDSAPAQVSGARVEHSGEVVGPATAVKGVSGAKPYITSGLTPMEVLSVLGNPTSSSGEKMVYRESEIYFRNGHVAGWKIDPKTAPIRVKLWPDAAPVPGMTTFAVGSSKSDVIALQGTPSLFSDNQFGYGGSVVFFQNDRVVGWKEDPASVRLRVMAH
jgi:curved DNA-binding protein CbpA